MCIRDRIIRVASTDHKPAAVDEVAVTEVDTEVVSDEMLDVALDLSLIHIYRFISRQLWRFVKDDQIEFVSIRINELSNGKRAH